MKLRHALLLLGLAIYLSVNAHAASPPVMPTDITLGNVRLVLMTASQITVFPNEVDKAQKFPPWKDSKQGVPCFAVTFLVESLSGEPIAPKTLKDLVVLSGGKPLQLTSQGGGYQQWFDYNVFQGFLDFTKPKVANPKRAFIMRYARFGAIPSLKPFSLEIEAGFGKDIQKFKFDSVGLQ